MTVGSNLDWTGIGLSGGRYQVTAKLGEGGMGYVFVARDKRLQTDVVIKVPRGNAPDDEFVQRFSREIRSLVRLSHPHIVKITDVDEHDGLPFAVMQFLSGGSLEDHQRRQQEQPLADRLRGTLQWLPSVANALDFISAQGYVHRDVKPGNILFDEHGNAYLSDFGVAKVLASDQGQDPKQGFTRVGMVLGTPEYMAPELIMGKPIDGRIDQYALAVTVFECLSGRRPIDGTTANGIYVAQVTQPPLDLCTAMPGIPVAISDVVKRALSKDPNNRFPTSTAFANAFDAAMRDALCSQPTQPVDPPRQKTQTFHRPSTETPAGKHDPTEARPVPESKRAKPEVENPVAGPTGTAEAKKVGLGWRLLVCALAATLVPLVALPFLRGTKKPAGTIHITVIPPDARDLKVFIDERAVGHDELSHALALAPGDHRLRATAATFDPFQKAFDLHDADDITLTVAFTRSVAPTAPKGQPNKAHVEAPSPEPLPPPITNSIGMQLMLVPAGEFMMEPCVRVKVVMQADRDLQVRGAITELKYPRGFKQPAEVGIEVLP